VNDTRTGATDVGAPPRFDPWPDAVVHVEWFPAAARQAASRGDLVVIADVLSLSTTLTIAAGRDFTSLLYAPAEIGQLGGLDAAAAVLGARPTSPRRPVPAGQLSLSPRSILDAEPGQRVLFTSLNGAAVAAAAEQSPCVVVASLRNSAAAAGVIAAVLAAGLAARVTIVASGEHWSSTVPGATGLRPAIEDWIGAGVLAGRLAAAGHSLSPEAQAAMRAADPGLIRDCVSARELRAAGFGADVDLALDIDSSTAVPVRSGTASPREFRRWPDGGT
jgi:2-phosphosulfolactate phosphatase